MINNIDGRPKLLVNLAENKNHWIGISPQGTRSNRDGIGAKVTVITASRRYVQEVRSGMSYISSNNLAAALRSGFSASGGAHRSALA